MERQLYLGTYNERGSEGIYQVVLEHGRLQQPSLFAKLKNAKAVALDGTQLYLATTIEKDRQAGIAVYRRDGSLVSSVFFEEHTSCYVTWHAGKIYTANYHDGSVSVLTFENEQLKLEHHIIICPEAGCHQILFHGAYMFVPTLLMDCIWIFEVSTMKRVDRYDFQAGTGPRHGVFTSDHRYLYLVGELSNELFKIDLENMQIVGQMSVLEHEEKHVRGTAAIRLSKNEKTLYVSTRGKDVISVIDLETFSLKQVVYCGGHHPRDFVVTSKNLIVANRDSDNLAVFALNSNGLIDRETQVISVPAAVSIAVFG